MSLLEEMEKKIEFLTNTPEGKESMSEYINEIKNRSKSRIEYVGSTEFNKTYEIIYKLVKEHGRIDDTDIHYRLNNGRIDLETEEWNKFTDAIAEKFEGQEIKDIKSDFFKYHFEYKSLNVYFTHGQGTYCWVEYNKSNDRDIKLDNLLD